MPSLENRLRILTLFLILFALLLVGKLYFLQIINGGEFRAKAEHQYVAGINYFDRGSIYFTAKDETLVPAATVQNGFILSINPNQMIEYQEDLGSVYDQLNTIVPLDRDLFMIKAEKVGDPYEELAKRVSQSAADKIEALHIPGVAISTERWRIYPGETMAAHAIGLIGYGATGTELTGRYGLERSYEGVLKRTGDEAFVNFFAEIFANIKSAVNPNSSLEGDVVTTIEPSVEAFLEREIGQVNARYSSEFTGGIVIDPQTGEIKAMALVPAFDPNDPGSAPSSEVFQNKLVEDRYEMGSIMKALTYSIGLGEGVITPTTTYNDPGCMTLNTKTFCNYDQQSHGTKVTMQEALGQSLNTGAAFVALKVGTRKFDADMLKFGLEQKTGIDLPNEGINLVSNLKTGRDLEAAEASFGQGIALTPIGTVRALSAVANGGTLVTPHIVKEIKYKIGTTKSISYTSLDVRSRAVSEEASAAISKMLVGDVDAILANGTQSLPNYSVAAKTGTAQIPSPYGGYYQDQYIHSFFGYFPAYNPQFLVFLFTYYPKGVNYASETLTAPFFDITKFLINYYQIPPDREKAPPVAGI